MKNLLTQYTKYNLWANTKLVGFIESALAGDPSILDKELVSSFNTIRKTIYHIWDAEQVWYKRLNGESHSNYPGHDFKGGFSEFKKELFSQSQKFIDYVKNLDEKNLLSEFEYKSIEGKSYKNKIYESTHHCMNHSTFHRGQLITMLRHVGFTDLSSTDFITYIREEN